MALTRITKGVIKPNENYDTHNINSTGIVTAIGLDVNGNGDISGNLSVGGVLTYEDVTSIDSVGIITAQKDIHVGAGVSAVGVGTFGSLDIGGDIDVDGHTELDNGNVSGVVTFTNSPNAIQMNDNARVSFGTSLKTAITYNSSDSKTKIVNFNDTLQIGYRNTEIYHTNQARLTFDSGNTFSNVVNTSFSGANYNVVWIPSSDTFRFNDNAKLVLGTNGDASLYHNNSNLLISNTTGNIDVTGNVELNNDLDVDGHTNLDNVSIAGVTTFTGITTTSSTLFADDFSTSGIGTFADINVKNPVDTRITSIAPGALILSRDTPIILFKNNLSDSFDASIDVVSNELRFKGGGNNATSTRMVTTSSGVSFPQDIDVDGHTNLDNVSVAGVTTFSGTAHFGSNGSITSSANFSLSSNKLRVTGSDTVGIEVQRSSNATIQCTETTNNTDLQLRANSSGGLVRTASNTALNLGTFQKNRIQITNDGKVQIGLPGSSTSLPGAVEVVNIRAMTDGNLCVRAIGSIASAPSGSGVGIDVLNDANNAVKDLALRGSTIIFKNATNESLRIDSNGNVMMGRTSASKKFSIEEPGGSSGVHYLAQIGGSNHVSGYAVGIAFDPEGYAARTKMALVAEGTSQGYSRGKFHFLLDAANDSGEATLSESRMTITDAGNIGISRANPSYRLHIHTTPTNSTQVTGLSIANDASSAGVGGKINMGAANGFDSTSAAISGFYDGTGTSLSLHTSLTYASTNQTERFRISNDGTVTIGDVDPASSSALHIRSITSAETTLELSTKSNYNGSLPDAKISFTQQNGTEIARIKCDTHTGAANMADLVFWTNYGGLYERMKITRTGSVVIRHNGASDSDGYAALEARSTSDKHMIIAASSSNASNSNYSTIGFKLHPSAQNERVKAAIQCQGNGGGYGEVSRMMFCLDAIADNGNAQGNSDDERFRISPTTGVDVRRDKFGWSTFGHYTGSSRTLMRHVKEFGTGASSAVFNLIRVRRHYWGWGHYKFTIKRGYYSGIVEDVFYLNGHGRDDGSYNPSYVITQRQYGGDGSNFGYSNRIQITSPSTSSPGSSYAAYVDVQLNCPAYMYFQVEVEGYASAYSTDYTSLASDQYALM